MTMRIKLLLWLLMGFLFAAAAAPKAAAAVNILLSTSGGNVVATISGSVNTADLGGLVQQTASTVMVSDSGFLVAGGGGGYQQQVNDDCYTNVTLTGPYAFGTSDLFAQGNINTGDLVGILVAPNDLIPSNIFLPRGYVSGTALSGTTTWTGKSFASFGLTPGESYTWTWGSGGNVDSFTIQTVPEPSTFALLGLGVLGLAYVIRRQRQRLAA